MDGDGCARASGDAASRRGLARKMVRGRHRVIHQTIADKQVVTEVASVATTTIQRKVSKVRHIQQPMCTLSQLSI